jgi:hypothetical protein
MKNLHADVLYLHQIKSVRNVPEIIRYVFFISDL